MCINRNPSNTFGRRTEEERHLLCGFYCTEGSLCNRNLDCGHTYPSECADISFQKDGVYNVYPKGADYPKPAYCVIRNGIKWTVIHRRFDGSVNFSRNWEEYKQGFGNVKGAYWLGNEAIHLISTNGKHKLHIDLELRNGSRFYADYSLFKLNNESSQYLLNVTGYSGTAGDSMDNDTLDGRANGYNCARKFQSGWWFALCNFSDLNGNFTKYVPGVLQKWYMNLHYAAIIQSEMMITKY
ncbi:Angiopoietin-related protein 2,Angiopoietin-1 [Mytilus coruscus]|uniref:Angiopoietin-related protein 2,Angiopoietin-1 n=1 Tax=Mytilus coruscus TaxID=42192 RepID=A0A6J8F2E3_MYTCO|nr:Angiopoietin-related protein 2,Angiopoietin-1 [Mytilus coruscus]